MIRSIAFRTLLLETLEPRRLLTASYELPAAGPWGYTPAPATLYTPTAQLTSAGSRLLLPHVGGTAALQARVNSSSYSAILARLEDRATHFRARYNPTTIALPTTSPDPWRNFATELRNELVLYVSATNSTKKATYRQSIDDWVTKLSTWYGTSTAGTTGTNQTPVDDLVQASFCETFAFMHDWLKADTAFSATTRTRIHDTLIVAAQTLYDTFHGGVASQFVNAYEANHNHWEHFGLSIAAEALWGDTSSSLAPGELKGWLGSAMNNAYYVFQTLSPSGVPSEGYEYGSYDSEPTMLFAYLQKYLLSTPGYDFLSTPAFTNSPTARLNTMLPQARGSYSGYQDDEVNDVLAGGAWTYELLANKNSDPTAQYVGNAILNNIPITSTGQQFSRYSADWESLFFYDPSVPVANITNLPRNYSDGDIGVNTARTDWSMGANDYFFGFQAGPYAGANSVAKNGGMGRISGHTLPDEGNVLLYKGGSPIIPSAGYPEETITEPDGTVVTGKVQQNHNTVLFGGTDSQAGGPVEQLGGGGQWFSPNVTKQSEDSAELLSQSHVGGTHSYLADIGGVYRLADNRDPSGYIRPDYQRRVVFLDNGAVAIIDRIHVSQPRDMKFWLPIYDGGMTASGNTFAFTTKDGVSGKVINYSNIPGQTLSVSDYTLPQLYTYANSINRKVASISVTQQTDVVFAVVVGVNGVVENVPLVANASGATVNGVFYGWDRAPRGGPSALTFTTNQGFRPGLDVGGQSEVQWFGQFTGSSTDSTTPIMLVSAEGSNNVLSAPAYQADFATGASVSYTPYAKEMGLTDYGKTASVALSFDIRFDDTPSNQGTTAWTMDIGRDTGGTSQGTAATLVVRSDARLTLNYGGGTYTTTSQLTPSFTRVSFVLNYTTKKFSMTVGSSGTSAVSNVSFSSTAADQFGSWKLAPANDSTKYRRISIDNVSVGATNEAPPLPTGLIALAQGAAVALQWSDNADNETGYTLQRATDIDFTTGLAQFSVAADQSTFTDNTAAGGVTYYYRVRAEGTVASSANSDAAAVTLTPSPTSIQLVPASDTGTAGDNRTDLNNSSSAKSLTFTVNGTIAGSSVSLYAGSTLIGTATGTANSTIVVTNGTASLLDGTQAITAVQTVGGVASGSSTALSIAIDTSMSTLVGPPVINAGSPRPSSRSQIRTITWTFSEPVLAGIAQFSLFNRDTNTSVPLTGRDAVISGVTVTLNLDKVGVDGGAQLILANGNYQLQLSPTVADVAGNALDANGDSTPGETARFNFFKLLGDFNASRSVSALDYSIWTSFFNQPVGPNVDSAFDLNGNGMVTALDYSIWQSRFGNTVVGNVDGLVYS